MMTTCRGRSHDELRRRAVRRFAELKKSGCRLALILNQANSTNPTELASVDFRLLLYDRIHVKSRVS